MIGTLLGLGVGAGLLGPLVWVAPILLILGSDRTSGLEKLLWVLAVVFVSWLAWIFYALLAPLAERR
jgi:hypothetical protein